MDYKRETKATIFPDFLPDRARKIAHNTYEYYREGQKAIRFHQTDIIIYQGDNIRLTSGGYHTMTTKDRLNSFSPYRVYTDKGLWIIHSSAGSFPFQDGMVFDLKTGRPDNIPPLEMIKAEFNKRKKQIDSFIRSYVYSIGTLPEPSAGDCFFCQLSAQNDHTRHGADSLISHIEENYQVPSLIFAAIRQCGESRAFIYDTAARFRKEPGTLFFEDNTYRKYAIRLLIKYFKKEGVYEIAHN